MRNNLLFWNYAELPVWCLHWLPHYLNTEVTEMNGGGGCPLSHSTYISVNNLIMKHNDLTVKVQHSPITLILINTVVTIMWLAFLNSSLLLVLLSFIILEHSWSHDNVNVCSFFLINVLIIFRSSLSSSSPSSDLCPWPQLKKSHLGLFSMASCCADSPVFLLTSWDPVRSFRLRWGLADW